MEQKETFNSNVHIQPFTEEETRFAFAASCVEMAARRLGCPYQEVYERMKKVGLIQPYLHQLDPLHTQSREYVTDEVVSALLRLEKEKGGQAC